MDERLEIAAREIIQEIEPYLDSNHVKLPTVLKTDLTRWKNKLTEALEA